MPVLKRPLRMHGSDGGQSASGEVSRPCAPTVENQSSYRDGTESEGTAESGSPRRSVYTFEAPDGYPQACCEQAALASLLARHLRASLTVHLDNVEHLSGSLAEIALDHIAHLSELRSKG